MVSMKVEDAIFTVSHKGVQVAAHNDVDKNFYELFDAFNKSIALDCPKRA